MLNLCHHQAFTQAWSAKSTKKKLSIREDIYLQYLREIKKLGPTIPLRDVDTDCFNVLQQAVKGIVRRYDLFIRLRLHCFVQP